MKKMLLSSIVACLCSLFFLTGCHAQEITLVKNGTSTAQIVISANASSTEEYAASELQRAIQKISGAELPVTNTISKSTFNIVIGTPQSVPEIKAANLLNTKNLEEICIVTRGKVLFLAGPTPGAALFAVYTYLQEELDCRWYWPGESGEYLPSLKTIFVKDLDITEAPDINLRSLAINAPHWDEDTTIWMSRNRMNWYALQGSTITHEHIADLHEKGIKARIGGHNITLPEKLLDEHPEYRALWGAKRQGDQLCWGNPDVQDAVAQKIIDWWKNNPNIDGITLMAADNTHFCDDKLCRALAPDISTRWQKFCKAVMDKVNKVYPDKVYQSLAYQDYRNVPTSVAPFSFIAYTAYNINYTKPITDSSNDKARAEIEAWQKLGSNMGIRGYQFIPFNKAMYAPIEPLIVQEIAWAHKIGLKGWYSELKPYGYPQDTLPQDKDWVTHRMALYAVAQAMWNADIDPKSIVKDWAQHVFGPAAAPMESYYRSMETAWENSPEPLTYFLQPPASFAENFISVDLLKTADADFKNARTALNTIENTDSKKRIETQINLEAAMLDNWRKVLLLQQGRANHFKAEAAIAKTTPQMTAQPDDPAWKNVAALPAFEDKEKQAAAEATKVLLQWDNSALYLRFICDDNNISQLKINGQTHDSNVFGDDTIEIFLNDPSVAGHYFHLAINAKNVSYDAKVDGAMNFDKSWNPQFISKTSIGTNNWILDVKLPFASFGIDGKEGGSWRMSLKRDGAKRRTNTGWPDASYHNPAGFGEVTLVQKVTTPKRVLMYDAGRKSDNLRAALAKVGFTVSDISQDAAAFKSTFTGNFDAITLYHPSNGSFELSPELMRETVLPFLQNGGLVLIAATGNLPLNKWFPNLGATVKWSGWAMDAVRRTSSSQNGAWQQQPHDLTNVISKKLAPGSAYEPVSGKWEILASQKNKAGVEIPYLLRLKVGKGALIITSSNFGYGGGGEMFGSGNPDNAAMLLDNSLVAARSSS